MIKPQGSPRNRRPSARTLPYGTEQRRPTALLGRASVFCGLLPAALFGVGVLARPDPLVLGLFLPGILAGIAAVWLIGLVVGVAGFRAGGQNKQPAALGIGLGVLWPILAAIPLVADNITQRDRDEGYIAARLRSGAILAARAVAESQRGGAFPQHVDTDGGSHVYFGRGLTRSDAFERVAGRIILSCSFDLPKTRGRVFTFADGTCRFVPPEQLDSVLAADDEARLSIGHKEIGNYLRTYMAVRQ